jgi:hypothetical protein
MTPEEDDDYRLQERRRTIDHVKDVMGEVIKEWMDEQFAKVGKWTLRGLMVILFSLFVHIFIASHTATYIARLLESDYPIQP